jgi:hypothetical protein
MARRARVLHAASHVQRGPFQEGSPSPTGTGTRMLAILARTPVRRCYSLLKPDIDPSGTRSPQWMQGAPDKKVTRYEVPASSYLDLGLVSVLANRGRPCLLLRKACTTAGRECPLLRFEHLDNAARFESSTPCRDSPCTSWRKYCRRPSRTGRGPARFDGQEQLPFRTATPSCEHESGGSMSR